MGDFLTAVPALRALARAFPNHWRVLAAPPALAPLARRCGAIDELVPAEPLEPLSTHLRDADIAVNLHGCGPQSHRVLLDARPRRLVAFACDGVYEGEALPRWNAAEHEIERWCRMLEAHGIACDPTDLDLIEEAKAHERRYVVLHPGASSEARCWPVDRWIDLASALTERDVPIRITGSADEFRRARRIARGAGLGIDSVIAGKTSLDRLTDVVADARAVVCGDTGVAHLATAMRTPSVVLFGPMSPLRWGPPRNRPRHRAIWRGREGDVHAKTTDPGLAAIGVNEVLENLFAVWE